MLSTLLIGIFTSSEPVSHALQQHLGVTASNAHWFSVETDFLAWVDTNRYRIDCLVIEQYPGLTALLEELLQQKNLLPLVVVLGSDSSSENSDSRDEADDSAIIAPARSAPASEAASTPDVTFSDRYHQAVVSINHQELVQIEAEVARAIEQFLKISSPGKAVGATDTDALENTSRALQQQQQRLTDKLKERLGYLGVYYKRHPDNFLRNMSSTERDEFLQQLRTDYRAIILSYFSNDPHLNQKIDNFVNLAFFADVSVSRIVEIHMELMEEFSKQLKLEGRNEEILLDYRLTLIDVIAHLCEMYRRSIPREV